MVGDIWDSRWFDWTVFVNVYSWVSQSKILGRVSGLVSVYHCISRTADISHLGHALGCGLVSVYHCISRTADISHLGHALGCGLVSVYHCISRTADISHLGHALGCGLVSVYHCISRTADISHLGHALGCGLVSVYYCNFTLDISNPRYLALIKAISPGVDLCQCIIVILRWISRTDMLWKRKSGLTLFVVRCILLNVTRFSVLDLPISRVKLNNVSIQSLKSATVTAFLNVNLIIF